MLLTRALALLETKTSAVQERTQEQVTPSNHAITQLLQQTQNSYLSYRTKVQSHIMGQLQQNKAYQSCQSLVEQLRELNKESQKRR